MKRLYCPPEIEFKEIELKRDILGDSIPEVIKETGVVITPDLEGDW